MDQIGRYEVKSEIGRGGCGVVYLAHDPVTQRDVAVKLLPAIGAPAWWARFRSETWATGRLQHKNIVAVRDCGEHDGRPFLVMDLLEGRSLQEAIRSGPPLSLGEKVSVLSRVGEGLRFAHERGVVHGDVKPSNVMLLHDGGVEILDFGIARYLDSAGSPQTTPGAIEYMSPDQLKGFAADPLTDIFSFGITCYELLSGHQPFRADDASRVLYLLASADPAPLRQVVPGCPETLQNVVRTALAKDRPKRYQNVRELLLELAPIETTLNKERAMHLAAEAGRLIEIGDFDAAQASLKRALELDPACEKGQELSREVQQRRGAEEQRRPQDRQRRQDPAPDLTQAARGHMETRRFAAAMRRADGALGQPPGEEILQEAGAAVHHARRRFAAGLEAERRQALDQLRQAEEQLRLLDAGNAKERPEGKASPATPERAKAGLTPPSAPARPVPVLTAEGTPAPPPALRTPTSGLASPRSRLREGMAVLAAAGLLALVLVLWFSPQRNQIERSQPSELAGLQAAIPKALASHKWQQAGASIARFEQLAPGDPRAAGWREQMAAGSALDQRLDDLRSSIGNAIRDRDWATADAGIARLRAMAPEDPQAATWQAEVAAGRTAVPPDKTAVPPVKKESKPADSHQAELARAEQLFQHGEYQAAMGLFQRVLTQDPGNARARNGLKRASDAKATEELLTGGGR
jgi:tetratricopeptide (TPR) repeat protein